MEDLINTWSFKPGDVSRLVKMHTHFIKEGSSKIFLVDLLYHVKRSLDGSEYKIEINNIPNPFSTTFPNINRNSYESGLGNRGIVEVARETLGVNMGDVHVYMTKEPQPRKMTIEEIEKELGYKVEVIGEE